MNYKLPLQDFSFSKQRQIGYHMTHHKNCNNTMSLYKNLMLFPCVLEEPLIIYQRNNNLPKLNLNIDRGFRAALKDYEIYFKKRKSKEKKKKEGKKRKSSLVFLGNDKDSKFLEKYQCVKVFYLKK